MIVKKRQNVCWYMSIKKNEFSYYPRHRFHDSSQILIFQI